MAELTRPRELSPDSVRFLSRGSDEWRRQLLHPCPLSWSKASLSLFGLILRARPAARYYDLG